ncbi:glutathione S-transferase family protein [Acuticoccus sp. M5D2P5]|uniref:glutathione S-transferase family protein n=1 Tax=Acuticoccus kalidii TaxID=2910977 RepID=UPI001F3FEB80|nr:glutathione S-transferase family protein [Acuticoccus kalidii]MCF3934300.1 glutathione S-transferase family protein [Acuticoccus kalidii]
MSLRLVIGNKNYSSWSMRPWLVLDHFGFAFEETLIPLDMPETADAIRAHSPAGRVPVLIDGGLTLWESLAIIEYLAEKAPDRAIWPADPAARAMARCLASEMHAGFMGLRAACPMNIRARRSHRPRGEAETADVARFEALVADALGTHGGPFLFGDWCAADAMFAPLVSRLSTYGWPIAETTRAYVDAVESEASFHRWREAALAEEWVLPREEVE